MLRPWIVLRLVIPSVWFGLVVGLSFVGTPLRLLAPGIAAPPGLGAARSVLTAVAIAGWVLLVALTLVALPTPRIERADWAVLAALWVVLALQSFAIRPALGVRGDVVREGGDPGESWLHVGYVAADVALLVLLVVWVVRAGRGIRTDSPV